MYDDSVEAGGEARVFDLLAVGVVFGSGEFRVVGLPHQGRQAHVDGRIFDAVDAACFVVLADEAERIEDLGFVAALVVDATVAASLPAGLRHEGGHELDVKAMASELSDAGCAFHQKPFWTDPSALEVIGVGSVEEHDGAGGRFFSEGGAFPFDAEERASAGGFTV